MPTDTKRWSGKRRGGSHKARSSSNQGRGGRRVKEKVIGEADLRIESLAGLGDGVASYEGTPVYIAKTMPGDLVRVSLSRVGGQVRGRLIDVLEAGSERAEPPCPHFESCGGCSLQMMQPEAYTDFKLKRLKIALERAGVMFSEILPVATSKAESRRRIALKAVRRGKTLSLGFMEGASHSVVDIESCIVAKPELTALFKPLRGLMLALLADGRTATVHLTACSNGVDVLLDGVSELSLAEREMMAEFAHKHDLARLSIRSAEGEEPAVMLRVPVVELAGASVPLSPAPFLQATEDGEAALTAFVRGVIADAVAAPSKHTSGAARAYDLFAGVGTFTFELAKQYPTIAVEADAKALANLKAGRDGSAQKMRLKGIALEEKDLFKQPIMLDALADADVVLFDPPRAGAKAQADYLAVSKVRHVIAVSCNPDTFARDAATLIEGGYKAKRLLPVDQFLWSPHLECAAYFEKQV